MDLDFRTMLRVFLLVGGLVYVVWGAFQARQTLIAIGALAVVVGLIGLWREGIGRKAE